MSARPAVGVRPALLALVAGVGAAVVIGGWAGVVAAAPVVVLAYRWLAGQPSSEERREARRIEVDLPFVAELLAAVLRAGAPPDVAARQVGTAVDGPVGERLLRVGRALRLGAGAVEAWSHLGSQPAAGRVVDAAARSQHSGAALAGALSRIAEDLRADRVTGADAAGRRAGVIVLPLGLCFLPAFVLAGLVPVIVSVIGDALSRS